MYLTDLFICGNPMRIPIKITNKEFSIPPPEMEKSFSDDLKGILWSMLDYVYYIIHFH
jgi:hypothetical protein